MRTKCVDQMYANRSRNQTWPWRVWGLAEDCPTVMSTDVCTGQICLARASDHSGFVGAFGNHE